MNAVLQGVGSQIRHRARAWAAKREGVDPHSVCLHSRRIYILPTRPGVIFGVIVFVMLLGAMNYNNNMGFALTFLLSGVGIVSIYHCHRNLAEVYFHYRRANPVFSGNPIGLQFVIENRSMLTRWQIEAGWDGHDKVCDELEPNSQAMLTLPLPTAQRGMISAPRIQLCTRFPLGLFQAWAWVNMDISEIVYPRPAEQIAMPLHGDPGFVSAGHSADGDDDFSGLRNYRLGDPPKHIAWKRFARTSEKLVTEYHSGPEDLIWIDWAALKDPDVETRIAQMTRMVVDCDAAGRNYGLRLPDIELRPAGGPQHRHECLKTLALFAPGTSA